MTVDLSNFDQLRAEIGAICQRYGREPDEVHLLAASKTRSLAEIAALARHGQRAFGENYLQEALPKIAQLCDLDIEWHFIGRIQANKTRQIAEHFAWVHTLTREKVARRLNAQRPPDLPPLNVCVAINLSGECSKDGITLAELPDFLASIAGSDRLRVRGLMALPAPQADFAQQRSAFQPLIAAMAHPALAQYALDTLSLGTSSDFAAAIAAGSTWVRLGTAIFGPRR